MKRLLRIKLLLLPPLFWIIWLLWLFNGQQQTEQYFSEVSGQVWQFKQAVWTAEMQQMFIQGTEEEKFLLRLRDENKEVIYNREFIIDHDLRLIGGFVKVAQLDDDPELEILFIDQNQPFEQNFYLDLSNAEVEEKSCQRLSLEMRQHISDWFSSHSPNLFEILGKVGLTFIFYIGCFIYYGFMP